MSNEHLSIIEEDEDIILEVPYLNILLMLFHIQKN
jgi:hypothetical protein